MTATTWLVNATVITMDPARPLASALAIRDGRIAELAGGPGIGAAAGAAGGAPVQGGGRQPRPLRGERTVDLGGATVLPGFVDAHNHFSLAALEGFWADCRTPPLASVPDLQTALRAVARSTPAGQWVRGYGYHHVALAERRHPTRDELDEAVPDHPAFLVHFSHHQGVANSSALRAGGIERGTPDPPGGEIGRDRGGEPTGLLFERAMAAVEDASRAGWQSRFPGAAAAASRRYAAVGITTVQDAAVGPPMEARYREAERDSRLGIRVLRMAVSAAGWFEPPWELARTRVPEGGTGWLKVFVDGGYRCAMRLGHDGRTARRGFLFYTRDELSALLVAAWGHGWRVTCHALGNLGLETCLDGVEDAVRREPRGADRIRIDHALFVDKAILARLKALGAPVVTQPVFLHDQGVVADGRLGGLYQRPFGRLRDAGVPQAFSSDYPCGGLAPLTGIHAAVTRRSRHGGRVDDEPGVPVEAALGAYTIEAARAGGLDRLCGSLVAGKAADLVVLDRNPLDLAPDDLGRIGVLATFAEGRQVWPDGPGLGNFSAPGQSKR
jgi:predicted amidohydrolase YtcJ